MARYGIEISQEGTPLKRAADYQKSLDERWPYLDIEIEQEVRFSKADWIAGTTYFWVKELVTHNLGYIPAFQWREIGTTLLAEGNFYGMKVIATKDKIYIRGLRFNGDPDTPINLQILVRVFACDITAEYRNPIDTVTPGPRVSAPKYGMRILKAGKPSRRIASDEMSDYALNTDAKALAIQQTGTRTPTTPDANNFNIFIDHNLGIPPIYFLAKLETPADFADTTIYANPLPEDTIIEGMNSYLTGIAAVTTKDLKIRGAQGILTATYAFLILKDPIGFSA